MFRLSRQYVVMGLLVAILLQPTSSAHGSVALRPVEPPRWNTPNVPNSFAWYEGLSQYSYITNCASIIQGFPYQEKGVGTYVGFLADPNAGQPAPNTTYYVHVVIAGLGNSCSGMRAYLDIALPANTSLAIDASNHVYCFYDGVQISPASDCPQSLRRPLTIQAPTPFRRLMWRMPTPGPSRRGISLRFRFRSNQAPR